MKNSIYQYSDYKALVLALIKSKPRGGRGVRTELAKYIHCQTPFITQVLSGNLHFSDEQAEACGRYFEMNRNELEYFLFLVTYEKAGTKSLREFIQISLEKIRERNRDVGERIAIENQLNNNVQKKYYSSWQYSAIHMALTMPNIRTVSALIDRLGISKAKTEEILNFLHENGLITKHLNHYHVKDQLLHLKKDSLMLNKHHLNIRLRALQSLDESFKTNVHYSAFFTCSKNDLVVLQELLLKTLENYKKIVKSSPEEELVGITLDLFKV